MTRIIGLDPGLRNTGWGIIEAEVSRLIYVADGAVHSDADAPLAERLAAACGLPVKKLGARPGSLGAWFGESLGKPILTLELPRDAPHDADALWARCGAGLTDLILRP